MSEKRVSKKRVSKKAICPFYIGETTPTVYCQGVKKGNYIHVAFDRCDLAKKHKHEYCYLHYHECEVFNMLFEAFYNK